MTDRDTLHPLRPFLKNFVWEHGRIGTRYLDCADGEIKFDEGKKSRFASEEIVYVPLGPETEEQPPGDGPAIHEAGLARFLRATQLGLPDEAGSAAEVQRAVQDCVDLGVLSAYQHEAKRLKATYALEAMFDDEIRAAVISDIRKTYVGMRDHLTLYDFTVLYGLPAPLLFSETPFIDWRTGAGLALPLVSLVLGPYCLLVGTPSARKSRVAPLIWKAAASMGPLKDHNHLMAERARLWLVATTDEQLASVQSRRFADRPGAAKPTLRP
jgi:hypothetical protein